MNTVLVAIKEAANEVGQGEEVRERLRQELPHLDVTIADTLDAALAAPPPDILITTSHDWLPELVRERPGLHWVHLLSAGADRLLQQDLPFERLRLSTSSGVHAATIAEYVLAGALHHTKAFGRFVHQQRERRWERPALDELEGSTIGILGLGAIGHAIATRAKAFGMSTTGTKRTPGDMPGVDEVHPPEGLHAVLRRSHVIAVTVPLTPTTRGLLSAPEFAAMRDDAILINVARGHVIDEPAMIDALREERIRGAVLDVFEQEPLPPESPLWDLPNVLITPHVAGTTPAYMRKAVRIFAENYRSLESTGELTTPVDVAAGY
jgi:phosphoglycerate dehydrogenase-like enzyme